MAASSGDLNHRAGYISLARRVRRGYSREVSATGADGNHLTAGRDLYIAFLQEAEFLAGLDFSEAISRLRESIAAIPELAEVIGRTNFEKAAVCFDHVADIEAEAYTSLSKMLGVTGLTVAG